MRNIKLLSAAALTLTLIGCGDEASDSKRDITPEGMFTNVVGGLASDDGAQRAGALPDGEFSRTDAIQAADTVAIWAIAGGEDLGTAQVATDGTFQFDGISTSDGPFIVEARVDGETVGQVLLPGTQGGQRFSVTMPISTETTVETEAYLTLLERGVSMQEIDIATLSESITRQMATRVESGDVLADAVWAAQAAFIDRLEANGSDINEFALTKARVAAYNDLAATVSEGRITLGWRNYGFTTANVLRQLGISIELQAEAAHAAAFAMIKKLPAEAALAAEALSACTFGEFEARAQVELAGKITGMNAVAERIDSEYDNYLTELRSAADRAGIYTARQNLKQRLTDGESSALGATLRRGLDDDISDGTTVPAESFPVFMSSLETQLAGPRSNLQTRLAEVSEPEAAIQAITEFRIQANEVVQATFGTGLNDQVRTLAVEIITSAEISVSPFGGPIQ